MPFRTRYGRHYHESEGCPAIAGKETESCSPAGLEPCAICCGKGTSGGGTAAAGATGGVSLRDEAPAREDSQDAPPAGQRGKSVAEAGSLSADTRMPLPDGTAITAAGIEGARRRNERAAETARKKKERHRLAPATAVPDIGTKPTRPRRDDYETYEEYVAARAEGRRRRHEFQERLDSLVGEIASMPTTGYDSVEAVAEWAAERGIEVDRRFYEIVDPREMDCIVSTLDALMDEYPQVLEMFERAGVRFRIGTDPIAWAEMDASGGLNVSEMAARSYEDAIRGFVSQYSVEEYNEQVGRNLRGLARGNGTLQTEVSHEFGHNLDQAIRDKFVSVGKDGDEDLDFDLFRQYDRELVELTLRHSTSAYSLTNTLEAFAEGFAEYSTNPDSEYGAAFGRFLRRWLAHPGTSGRHDDWGF